MMRGGRNWQGPSRKARQQGPKDTRCLRNAGFEIDGAPLCGQHAGARALRLLLDETK